MTFSMSQTDKIKMLVLTLCFCQSISTEHGVSHELASIPNTPGRDILAKSAIFFFYNSPYKNGSFQEIVAPFSEFAEDIISIIGIVFILVKALSWLFFSFTDWENANLKGKLPDDFYNDLGWFINQSCYHPSLINVIYYKFWRRFFFVVEENNFLLMIINS